MVRASNSHAFRSYGHFCVLAFSEHSRLKTRVPGLEFKFKFVCKRCGFGDTVSL